MADNKHWFKVWTSILTDPSMADCHNNIIGAWVRLGALVAQHGEGGSVTISKAHLVRTLHLFTANDDEIQTVFDELLKLNIIIEECNTEFTVTFKKWHKYQADKSNERVKKHRESVTVQEEKRREEKKKRKEKNKVYTESFLAFYDLYPRKVGKDDAFKAWFKLNPDSALIEKIMSSVREHAKEWVGREKRYIPHPASWLNGKRFNDEICEPLLETQNNGLNMFEVMNDES